MMKTTVLGLLLMINISAVFGAEMLHLDACYNSETDIAFSEKKGEDHLSGDFHRSLTQDQEEIMDQFDLVFSHFKVKNTDYEPMSYLLWTGKENKTWVLYKSQDQKYFTLTRTGRLVPYPDNEYMKFDHNANKVRIDLDPGSLTDVYILYEKHESLSGHDSYKFADLKSWEKEYYVEKYNKNITMGIFYGILIALALINLIFYIVYKDRNYPIYSIYIILFLLYDFTVYGLLREYTVLSSYPKLEYALDNFFLNGAIIFYLVFLMNFIDIRNYPVWGKIIPFIIGLCTMNIIVVGITILYFEDINLGFLIRNVMILPIMPFSIIFLFKLFKSKVQTDKIFFYGSMILLLFGLLSILDFLLAYSDYTDQTLRIGIILEGIIFSVGLGMKVKVANKENISAQKELIEQLEKNEKMQHSLNQELEILVSQKTDELQIRNLELERTRNSLEEKVQERTYQLSKSNQELVTQNQQLGQYAFITAHNLRAPVARLKGLTYLFKNDQSLQISLEGEVGKIVYQISCAAEDLDITLGDLNKVLNTKSEINIKEQFSIVDSIDRVKSSLKDEISKNNTTIQSRMAFEWMYSGKAYFESIFYNLISNAIKYRQLEVDPVIKIINEIDGDTLRFIIEDNGIGIDLEKYQEKIFGLYQRFHLHVDGKGMGLFMVKTQVESLGGIIKIKSNPGLGTLFILEFPMDNIADYSMIRYADKIVES